MMQASLAEFIQASAEAGYLLNRQYMPFYKWRLRAMEAFICVRELKGALEQLAGSRPDEEETEERIENVCGIILDELKKQGLTDSDELFLERQKAEVLSRMEKLSGGKTQKRRNLLNLMLLRQRKSGLWQMRLPLWSGSSLHR